MPEKRAVAAGQSHTFTSTTVLTILGLSLYWPFFPRGEFEALFSFCSDAQTATWDVYSTIMVSLALFLLLGVSLRNELEALLATARGGIALLGALGSAGYLCEVFSFCLGEAASSLRLLGALLIALSYAALTFAWMRLLADRNLSDSFLSIAASFFVSSLLTLVVYTPWPLPLMCTVASPAASTLIWLTVRSRLNVEDSERLPECSWEGLTKLPLALVGVFSVFLIAGRSTVGLLFFDSGAIPIDQRICTVLISCGVLCVVLTSLLRMRQWEVLFQTGWAFLAVLFLIGLLMLLLQDGGLLQIGSAIMSGSLFCFEIVLWVLLMRAVKEHALSTVLVFGLATLLVKVVPHYCGKFLIPAMAANANLAIIENPTVFVVAMALLLMATTVLFINARLFRQLYETSGRADQVAEEAPAPMATTPAGQDGIEESARRLAAAASLTPRETDVMLLMARGFSYQKIADELVISLGTTQGHAKNVYRKLGVHTKQELIDAVHESRC